MESSHGTSPSARRRHPVRGWAIGAALALCSAALPAQRHVVVPARAEQVDAESVAFWALSPYEARRQVLIDARELPPPPVPFSALDVRRDGGTFADTLEASAVAVRLWLSSSDTADAAAPSPRFADNRGPAPVLAFDGRIDLPAVGPLQAGVAPWAAPQAIRIPFGTPYVHLRGTLCIETETRLVDDPSSGRALRAFWPVDAARVPFGGQVLVLGQGCLDDASPEPAETDPSGHVPGGTGSFSLRGEIESGVAMLAVGVDTASFGGVPLPIDLGPVGARGCVLRVAPLATVPAPLVELPGDDDQHQALVRFDWPFDPLLSGQRIAAQWLVFGITDEGADFGLSNGLEIVLGPALADLRFGMVEQADLSSPRGEVHRGRAPVLRLHW